MGTDSRVVKAWEGWIRGGGTEWEKRGALVIFSTIDTFFLKKRKKTYPVDATVK